MPIQAEQSILERADSKLQPNDWLLIPTSIVKFKRTTSRLIHPLRKWEWMTGKTERSILPILILKYRQKWHQDWIWNCVEEPTIKLSATSTNCSWATAMTTSISWNHKKYHRLKFNVKKYLLSLCQFIESSWKSWSVEGQEHQKIRKLMRIVWFYFWGGTQKKTPNSQT